VQGLHSQTRKGEARNELSNEASPEQRVCGVCVQPDPHVQRELAYRHACVNKSFNAAHVRAVATHRLIDLLKLVSSAGCVVGVGVWSGSL
jgi:hypothetical protein